MLRNELRRRRGLTVLPHSVAWGLAGVRLVRRSRNRDQEAHTAQDLINPVLGSQTMEDRLLELESSNAYLTKRVADLDDVVLEFTRRVERLERQVVAMSQRLEEYGEPAERDEAPPPHY